MIWIDFHPHGRGASSHRSDASNNSRSGKALEDLGDGERGSEGEDMEGCMRACRSAREARGPRLCGRSRRAEVGRSRAVPKANNRIARGLWRGRVSLPPLCASAPEVEPQEAAKEADSAPSIIDDLKQTAMSLHTKDQAASGGQKAKKRPEFKPTRSGYLRYLVDSRAVFSTMEDIVQRKAELAGLKENGLERSGALDRDIAFLESQGVSPAAVEGDESPGSEYAAYLRDLADANLPGFVCHYYNTYFAHTAGGRMIGKAVSDKILDGAKLDFYHDYPEAVSKLSRRVKEGLEGVASDWSEDERQSCVSETGKAFKYAGLVMRQMTIAEEE